MKWNTIISSFLIITAVYSCQNDDEAVQTEESPAVDEKDKNKLEKAAWLLGSWEDASEEGKLTETWVKSGKNAYKAETYLVFGTDTVFREYSQLNKAGKTLHCIITIPDQNDAKPVVFKLTRQEDNLLVFENQKHDFPQVITYTHKGDSVIAEISGMQKGELAKERFEMVKVK